MARVNLYISNEVHEKINMIVEKRRQEGARDKDISLSGTASMLLELGLRVYDAQMERKESAFNQTEFNKLLLECVVKTQSTVAKILGIESLSPHVSGNPKFDGFAPIFPDTCYHLTHYWPAAADIPVASDNPVHYADAIRYNARTPLQGSLLPLTRLV